jgi:hypothetical protein
VSDTAAAEAAVAGVEVDPLVADEDGDLALEDVERLVLVVVQVPGRPAAARVVGLDLRKRVAGLGTACFDRLQRVNGDTPERRLTPSSLSAIISLGDPAGRPGDFSAVPGFGSESEGRVKAAISSSGVLARVACLVAALLTVGVVAAAPAAAAAQSTPFGVTGKVTHVNLAAKTFNVSSLQGHKTYTIHTNSKTHFLISRASGTLARLKTGMTVVVSCTVAGTVYTATSVGAL